MLYQFTFILFFSFNFFQLVHQTSTSSLAPNKNCCVQRKKKNQKEEKKEKKKYNVEGGRLKETLLHHLLLRDHIIAPLASIYSARDVVTKLTGFSLGVLSLQSQFCQ